MKTLYILGNGFDMAQHMATSYGDFYKYLESVEIHNKSLKRMMEDIKNQPENWSDLELELGKFSSKVENADDFIEMLEELNDHLQNHLEDQQQKQNFEFKQELFASKFFDHTNYLYASYKDQYDKFTSHLEFDPTDKIDVITFNYTDTFERLTAIGLQKWDDVDIVHVHGQLGNTIIFGVDTVEQLANESFRDNDDVKDYIIKSQTDAVLKSARQGRCRQLISEANVIILYGVSLGETDDHWWKLIGQQLSHRDDLAVVLHWYAPSIERKKQQRLGKYEREIIPKLVERFGINYIDYLVSLNERFFIVINRDIFDLDIKIV